MFYFCVVEYIRFYDLCAILSKASSISKFLKNSFFTLVLFLFKLLIYLRLFFDKYQEVGNQYFLLNEYTQLPQHILFNNQNFFADLKQHSFIYYISKYFWFSFGLSYPLICLAILMLTLIFFLHIKEHT